MRHERLAHLMQTHLDALAAGQEPILVHETILGIFQALYQGDITTGRAIYLLNYQAMHWSDEPAQAILYRQAAADLRTIQRKEQ